ncbi:metallophosphoesterase [Clostridium swellfunianum]|uniref:metallophosphoesterase n=1 Tax=Clostridium swellfunianum TaxID=1367462 RepID=UPI00202F131B|nr:metallophosphoesterase [Clostridium swellfunianum]MCM0650731.1 metallophosphoesterase [Clostridium swellfunianum]
MKIAVISDTHRHRYSLNQIVKLIDDTDMLIHLGDNVEDVETFQANYKGKIINVRGNCDFTSFTPAERLEEIEGKKVYITHGHRYDVKYGLLKLKYRAKEVGADIVLFGHTHEFTEIYEDGIWFINPGSASLPRDSSKSIVILEISHNKVLVSVKNIK